MESCDEYIKESIIISYEGIGELNSEEQFPKSAPVGLPTSASNGQQVFDFNLSADIDSNNYKTGGMTPGSRNPQLYLRNNKTFDKVKGELIDGTIRICCENTKDKIEVNWMVMAERQDDNIKQSLFVNNEGNLICEKTRL